MKKLLSIHTPRHFYPDITCGDYFSDLAKDSPQFFFIQFVQKNKIIPRAIEFVKNNEYHRKNALTALTNLQSGNPSMLFVSHYIEHYLLYLFLDQKSIQPETLTHAFNFVNSMRHCRFIPNPPDQGGCSLLEFPKSKTQVINLFEPEHTYLIDALSDQLGIPNDTIYDTIQTQAPEFRFAFTLKTPSKFESDNFYSFKTNGLTFLSRVFEHIDQI